MLCICAWTHLNAFRIIEMLPTLSFRTEALISPVILKSDCSYLTAESPSRNFCQQIGAAFLKVKNFPEAPLIQYLVSARMPKSSSSYSDSGHLRRTIPGPEFPCEVPGPLLQFNSLICTILLLTFSSSAPLPLPHNPPSL